MKKFVIVLFAGILLVGTVFFSYKTVHEEILEKSMSVLKDSIHMHTAENMPEEVEELAPSPSVMPSKENIAKPQTKPSESASVEKEPAKIEDLTADDKAFLMGIYGRFSAAEISKMTKKLAGGLTNEEKQEIMEFLYGKLSKAEIDRLMKIADSM